MEAVFIGGSMLALMFIGVLSGIHIGVSLLFCSLLGSWLIMGDFATAASLMGTGPFYVLFEYELTVIPLFILMGLFVVVSRASDDLYNTFHVWLGRLPGGLAIATVLSNALFAAITGVSIASAAVFSKIALPQMEEHGYDKSLSLGTIAGSSVLGMLIPPSVLLIVYGIFSEQSIGKLFMAGFIPGIILTGVYSFGILAMVRIRPRLAGPLPAKETIAWLKRLRSLLDTWGVFALIVLVLGGIYAGFLTPTEAGAVGATGALLMSLLKRRMTAANMRHSLLETGLTTASFFLLFIGAQMFSRMLAVTGFVRVVTTTLVNLPVAPLTLIILILIVYLVLGTFVDSISIMVLTLPIMLPVVQSLGFDLIWFGIISTITIEMGLLTPPFGMVIFVMKSTLGTEVEIEQIFKGIIPFLLMMAATLVVLIACPVLSTWLPSMM
jgi:C4-dicarboxylate transporter DctM subunit